MKSNITETFFYHIYPLGLCNCNTKNDFSCSAGNCFEKLENELAKIKELGVNAIYIGPIFESTSHGYDTVDYYYVDRRLGNNQKFKDFCTKSHSMGIRVILDAVFNHTGRDFFAFKDIQKNGLNSKFNDWYLNLNFNKRSNYGDNFDYEGWAGCKDLVKLNVDNEKVREHLFGAIKFWKEEFGIDGLRLDAADVLSPSFLDALGEYCRNLDNDFWLLGEVVHGDYNNWARKNRIDSVTNYEIYKGLWSSFNSQNFFEIAYSLNRQFGENGIYKHLNLYNFVDNHDVNRVASILSNQAWLFPLYGLLFTIPGIPSIYYGSEYGLKGCRINNTDYQLRPSLPPFVEKTPDFAKPSINSQDLLKSIKKFSKIRNKIPSLSKGSYRQIFVSNKQFAFMREFYGDKTIVIVNCEDKKAYINLNESGNWKDELSGEGFSLPNKIEISANWLRILHFN